jgi:hypothetical protein
VNWQQLRAFLWLEWRLRVNQLKRAGVASVVIISILAVGAIVLSVTAFFLALFVGKSLLPRVSPTVVMFIWDGVIVTFLFCWLIGLLTELQRAELLSLEKFLHLPVSLKGAFLINYVSSLVSFTLIVFVPAMVGLAIASVASRGATMLVVFPLAAGFIFVVTSVTFQFRGWLASLMVNKRRCRTVLTLVTAGIILTAQLPNLINVFRPWDRRGPDDAAARMAAELAKLNQPTPAATVDAAKQEELRAAIVAQYEAEVAARRRQQLARAERIATIVNLAAPPGWLAYGAKAAAEGGVLPAVLATLAFSLLGAASVRRSYRTTLRIYTGQFSAGVATPPAAPAAAETTAKPGEKPSVALLEKRLPWVSEYASAIAVACFRSLTRAPEAKLLLLTPIIMVLVFGGMFLSRTQHLMPEIVRPLFASGAITMILFTMVQLVGNQFGFDRSGFRAYVLSSAPRRDILIGKNLAFAPLPLGLGVIGLVLVQWVYPMRFDHLVASVAQMISMFLVFCLVANLLSIIAPMPIAAGTLKPANPKGKIILIHVAFVFLFPVALAPTLIPLGVEAITQWISGLKAVPVCLILSLIELALAAFLYWIIVNGQGRLLHSREQRILEIVTAKVE